MGPSQPVDDLPLFLLMPRVKKSVISESRTFGPSWLAYASALIVPSPGICVPSSLGILIHLAGLRLRRHPGPLLAWELLIQEVDRLPLPP